MADLYTYNAQVIRIVDGDTCELLISLGFKLWYRINSRFAFINAPELNSTDEAIRNAAVAAKTALQEMIEGKQVMIHSKSLDKYGRPLVEMFLGTVSVNKWMIEHGFAVLV